MFRSCSKTRIILIMSYSLSNVTGLGRLSCQDESSRGLFSMGSASGSMSFINKLAMNTYGFNYPEIIMLAQMSVTVAALKLVHLMGKVNLPNYTRENARLCLFPSLFYVLNSTFALSALSGMNIPMYNVLKRTGPLFYIFLAVCILKKGWPSASTIGAVVLTTSGCIVAGKSFIPHLSIFTFKAPLHYL